MQYKNNTKISIDKRKLEILLRLGCQESIIWQAIKTGKIEKTGDKLIDENLETFMDIKEFNNWGGNHNPKGINQYKQKKKLGQVDRHLDHQVVQQDAGQVADIDKDIDKDIDNKKNIQENKYGELGLVRLTTEQYNALSSKYQSIDKAIEVLDTYLGTSGKKYRNQNHYAFFKSNSWVWERVGNFVDKKNNNAISKQGQIMEKNLALLKQYCEQGGSND